MNNPRSTYESEENYLRRCLKEAQAEAYGMRQQNEQRELERFCPRDDERREEY